MTTIIIDRAVLEQALEALEAMNPYSASKEETRNAVITALRKVFNAPSNDAPPSTDAGQAPKLDAEPKLVAWMYEFQGRAHITFTDWQFDPNWSGSLCCAIEQALKERA